MGTFNAVFAFSSGEKFDGAKFIFSCPLCLSFWSYRLLTCRGSGGLCYGNGSFFDIVASPKLQRILVLGIFGLQVDPALG